MAKRKCFSFVCESDGEGIETTVEAEIIGEQEAHAILLELRNAAVEIIQSLESFKKD